MVYEKRGSEELLERIGRPVQLDVDHLKHLVRAVEGVSGRILNWEVYGKPGIDRLKASFAVEPARLSSFVVSLIGNQARLGFEAFPEGVPPFDLQYRVDVFAGR